MHDPMTVAFDIKRPWPKLMKTERERRMWGRFYWPTWITIWHVDPEKDGTDDSCGWFIRSRHGDQKVLARIVSRFTFDWDRTHEGSNGYIYHCGWFKPNGQPHFSPIAIAVGMFHAAAGVMFAKGDGFNWKAAERFTQQHLAEIIRFAENPTDSLHDGITRKYEVGCGEEYNERRRQERIEQMASCVYSWILRRQRPWYRHPRWHFWHWKIQVHPLQNLKRWLFSRCCKCGKGFSWGYAPTSNSWDGTGPLWFRSEQGVYHSECSGHVMAGVVKANGQ